MGTVSPISRNTEEVTMTADKQKAKAPTIKDIAAIVGVSIATVSRVLNQDETMSVNDNTRRKIFATAEQLGYKKHRRANGKSKKQRRVVIVQWYTERQELQDLYYYSIRTGIERRLEELGYAITRVFNDSSNADIEGADGIIAVGKFSSEQVRTLGKFNKHTVFVDSDTLSAGFTCVMPDFINSVTGVIDHFLHHKQTNIGMIAGEEYNADKSAKLADRRYYTFRNYLTEWKLYNPKNMYIGSFTTSDGYRLMKQAIKDHPRDLPQAFFAANDSLAIGALRALQEAGIKVPEQVSLISFNDTAIAKQVFPQLSAVTVFTEQMGSTAAEIMDRELNGRQVSPVPFMMKFATKLTLRGTSIN